VLAFLRKAQTGGLRAAIAAGERDFALASVRQRAGARPLLESLSVHELPEAGAAQAVGSLLQQRKLSSAALSAVAGINDYQLVQVEAPEVLPSELRAAVRWRLRDIVHFDVEDAVVDVFEVPEAARRNQAKMVYAVVARKPAVQRLTNLVDGSAKGLDVIDIPELCLRNLALLLPQESATAMLALSTHFAQLIVMRNGILYLARRIDFHRRAPNFHQPGESGGIDASAIALELQRSLDYYESHFDQPAITNLLLAPTHERALELKTSLGQEMNLKVASLELESVLELAPGVQPPATWLSLVAIGAALRTDIQS
jgi:MSHA biogenesis protein MshI